MPSTLAVVHSDPGILGGSRCSIAWASRCTDEPVIAIMTERLLLRPITSDDFDAHARITGDSASSANRALLV